MSGEKLCPVCKEKGTKSKVYQHSAATLPVLGASRYWDEDGKFHDHAGSSIAQDYGCTLGHHWREHAKVSCWCGWTAGKEGIEILPPSLLQPGRGQK
jgi:hypothetical protein